MKSNITETQQDQIKLYADKKRIFLHEGKQYTFLDYTVHENDIDIYIKDASGEKDTWGIEAWQIETFFGWFDDYSHSVEEEPTVPSTNKISVEEPFASKLKVSISKPKKQKTMRNTRVSPILEPILSLLKTMLRQ